MAMMNKSRQTDNIMGVYAIWQEVKPTLIEYIEYIDKTATGYRVESKMLAHETIKHMESFLDLELITVHPTLDRTLIATYHFK